MNPCIEEKNKLSDEATKALTEYLNSRNEQTNIEQNEPHSYVENVYEISQKDFFLDYSRDVDFSEINEDAITILLKKGILEKRANGDLLSTDPRQTRAINKDEAVDVFKYVLQEDEQFVIKANPIIIEQIKDTYNAQILPNNNILFIAP